MAIPVDGEQQDLKLTFAVLDKYNGKTYEEVRHMNLLMAVTPTSTISFRGNVQQ
jgi:hypothetical protein